MIYLVDEDWMQLAAWRAELVMRGHKVEVLGDADEAFTALCGATDVDLALIDVMLAANEDATTSRYTRAATEDFMITGLNLLEDLTQQRPTVFPRRAIVLTNVTKTGGFLQRIELACRNYKIPVMQKFHFDSAFEFANRVEQRLRELK